MYYIFINLKIILTALGLLAGLPFSKKNFLNFNKIFNFDLELDLGSYYISFYRSQRADHEYMTYHLYEWSTDRLVNNLPQQKSIFQKVTI